MCCSSRRRGGGVKQIFHSSNGVISRCAKVGEGGCRVRMFQFVKKVGNNDD